MSKMKRLKAQWDNFDTKSDVKYETESTVSIVNFETTNQIVSRNFDQTLSTQNTQIIDISTWTNEAEIESQNQNHQWY